MFYAKDHKTLNMFDTLDDFGPKRRGRLERSWAKLFREEILPALPVEKLAGQYDEAKGRPTKELHAMLGLMLLQQMQDLPDEEAVDQFAFNRQWQYALGIESEGDEACYVSPRTLWSMREVLCREGLYESLFASVTQKLAKVFSVDTSRQRLDSTHVYSNMRHLSRVGIFVATIKKFLVNLKRHHRELFSTLDEEMVSRYLRKHGAGMFSLVKPSESSRALEVVAHDLFELVSLFGDKDAVVGMSSYRLLVRVLGEQCIVEEDVTGGGKVVLKAGGDVGSDSLQSPSDPDAGYDGHKGKGYHVQVMETWHPEGSGNGLSLITHVETSPAHASDTAALLPAIAGAQERGLGPAEILADTLYGSDDNGERAREERGVEVVAPAGGSGRRGDGYDLSDFHLNEDGVIVHCPQGHGPVETKRGKRGRHIARFGIETCEGCCDRPRCPVQKGKRFSGLWYSGKKGRLAKRRAYERTEEFQERYRFRAGIEATMSQGKSRTGLGRLRVRGLDAVRFCAALKAAGLNILRATACRNRTIAENGLCHGPRGSVSTALAWLVGQVTAFLRIIPRTKPDRYATWNATSTVMAQTPA